jgi:hypothetical protein
VQIADRGHLIKNLSGAVGGRSGHDPANHLHFFFCDTGTLNHITKIDTAGEFDFNLPLTIKVVKGRLNTCSKWKSSVILRLRR